MHIIAKRTLQQYWAKHLECKVPLTEWYRNVKKATWESPNELKAEYPKASILPNGRVVFNILGGRFRLIVKVQFKDKRVFIRWFGTHAEYDSIDATTA